MIILCFGNVGGGNANIRSAFISVFERGSAGQRQVAKHGKSGITARDRPAGDENWCGSGIPCFDSVALITGNFPAVDVDLIVVITGDMDGGTAAIANTVLHLSAVHIEHRLTTHRGAAQLDDALVECGVKYAAADLAAVQVQGRRTVAAVRVYFNGSPHVVGGRNYPAAFTVADVQRGIARHLDHDESAAELLSVQAEIECLAVRDRERTARRCVVAQIHIGGVGASIIRNLVCSVPRRPCDFFACLRMVADVCMRLAADGVAMLRRAGADAHQAHRRAQAQRRAQQSFPKSHDRISSPRLIRPSGPRRLWCGSAPQCFLSARRT